MRPTPFGISEPQQKYSLSVVHPTDYRDSGTFEFDSRMKADIMTADAAKEGYEYTLKENHDDGSRTTIYTSYPTD